MFYEWFIVRLLKSCFGIFGNKNFLFYFFAKANTICMKKIVLGLSILLFLGLLILLFFVGVEIFFDSYEIVCVPSIV